MAQLKRYGLGFDSAKGEDKYLMAYAKDSADALRAMKRTFRNYAGDIDRNANNLVGGSVNAPAEETETVAWDAS